MTDGVLPTLFVVSVVGEALHDELVNTVECGLFVRAILDRHGNKGYIRIRWLHHVFLGVVRSWISRVRGVPGGSSGGHGVGRGVLVVSCVTVREIGSHAADRECGAGGGHCACGHGGAVGPRPVGVVVPEESVHLEIVVCLRGGIQFDGCWRSEGNSSLSSLR